MDLSTAKCRKTVKKVLNFKKQKLKSFLAPFQRKPSWGLNKILSIANANKIICGIYLFLFISILCVTHAKSFFRRGTGKPIFTKNGFPDQVQLT